MAACSSTSAAAMSHAWGDEGLWESHVKDSCSSSEPASDSSSQASRTHGISNSYKEACQYASKRFVKQPCAFSLGVQSLCGQELEMGPTSAVLPEKLELMLIRSRVEQARKVESGHDCIEEVTGKPNKNKVFISLLREDNLAMSVEWSCRWKQEEEDVELELENCFFEVLMCELRVYVTCGLFFVIFNLRTALAATQAILYILEWTNRQCEL